MEKANALPQRVSGERLESWKEIGSYLNRDVRTVERWERTKGLPVHRLPGGGTARVYAFKPELDAWRSGRGLPSQEAALSPALLPSIAVLPFVNLGADRENEYFSDGLAEDIINALAKLPGLRIVARTSSFAFRGKSATAAEIAAKLKVATILEGSVRKAGTRIRVTAQLIKAADQSHLWEDWYDRELTDVFAIQDEISQAIVEKLRVRLAGDHPLVRRYTESTEAYQLYLKGRYCWNQKTEEGYKKGVQYFNQVIEKDPGFVLAYAGAADCYSSLGVHSYLAPKDAYPQAKAAATKALKLDENLAEAHTSLAAVAFRYDWNWQEAEKGFRHAIALNPNYWFAHIFYGYYLACMGRFEESLLECNRARELEPLSLHVNACLGLCCYFGREYEQAAKELTTTLEMDPSSAVAHCYLGLTYLQKQTLGDAIARFQRAVVLEGDNPVYIANLGIAYARAGKSSEASTILGDLQTLSKRRYVSPVWPALVLAYIGGKKDEAVEALERGFEDRFEFMHSLKVNPAFDPFRFDPRFQALLRRMKFPEK